MNIILSRKLVTALFLCITKFGFSQIWPIKQSDDPNNWNSISATFGEIHPTNGDHVHGAVDIDVNTFNCPVRAIESGRVLLSGGTSITLEHNFPAGSQNYYRKSKYIHVNSSSNLQAGVSVNQDDIITTVEPSTNNPQTANHLHFEMFQFVDGNWYKINPFGNSEGWQLGTPTDNAGPEINDVFLEPIVQANNVGSGFSIFKNSGALTNRTLNVKAHFLNRPGSTGTIFNYNNDKLIVYGNIIPTISARDVSINSSASGSGLTIHKVNYKIDDELKYEIYFDKVTEAEDNNVTEIFHTEFNTGNERLYGNNDFIELYTTNGVYLSPDKSINNQISNGVWFTKAKSNSQQVFSVTPTISAKENSEALYADGEHNLLFHVEDAASLTNEAELKVIVDNFRPYIKDIVIRKNSSIGNLIYTGNWTWNTTTSQLSVAKSQLNDANPTDKIWIQITTSEPVQSLQTNIPWSDIGTYRTADVVPNTDNKVFTITYNPITTSGSNPVNIRATDYAGNELQTNPAVIPIHQADGTWLPAASPGSDSNHQFKSGLGVCSAAPTGRLATSAVASSTMGTSSSCLYADVSASAANVALNDAVTYTPVTSGSGLLTYSWDFGAGALPATSTSAGPQTVVYSTTGAKTVTLKICDNTAQCITQTKTNIITVGQAQSSTLSVDFDADRYGANTDQTINLTSIVSGAVGTVTYSWDFGDEVTKGYFSDVNPSIAYKRPGHKTIRLTVTDANGSITKVRNDYLLITSFLSDLSVKITGCGETDPSGTINGLGSFVDGGNGGPYNSYSWDFGDGSAPGTGTIVSHQYKKSGKYTVSLTVCDDAVGCATGQQTGCVIAPSSVGTSSSTPTFLINNLPVSGSVQQVGLNSPVKFVCDNTGIGGVNVSSVDYTWKFDMQLGNVNGTTATPNFAETLGPQAQEVVYSTLGDKVVMLTTANGAVLRTSPFQSVLTVVSGKGKGTCFANIGDITLSATCWTDANKPRFTIPITGSNCPVKKFEVLYWSDKGGVVMPNGVLDFAAAGITPVFPITADFSFAAMQWDGVNYNTIGYKRQRFTIYGPVTADAGADKKVCLGSSVQIGSAPVDGKTYKWSSTTAPLSMLNNLAVANPIFNGVQKGTFAYTVTVTDLVGGCSSTDQISITVDQPVVTNSSFFTKMAVATPLTVTTSGGFGGNTYAWSPADNLSSTSIINPVFTSSAEGDFNYLVSVTDQRGCTGSGQIYVNAFSAPGNLQATSKAYSWVTLSWVDRTTNESSFTIRRSVNDALSFVDYASVSTDATTFNDFNVQKDVTYYYQVVANIAGTVSKGTNVASVHTGDLPAFAKVSAPGIILTQGDYDNDGQIEFVIQRSASIEIYKYLSYNQFTLWKTISIYADRAQTGDFDNDGDLDIVITPNWTSTTVTSKFVINNGSDFSIVDRSLLSTEITMIDYDSDNDIDLALLPPSTTGPTYYPVQLYRNTGANQFALDGSNNNLIAYYISRSKQNILSVGDYDNDGDADIVSSKMEGKEILYQNNNSVFNTSKELSQNIPLATEFGDFDKDGWLDVITSGVWDLRVQKNNQDGSYQDFLKFTSGNRDSQSGGNSTAHWGDFDSDGDLDFLISGIYLNSLLFCEIYRNTNNQFTLEYSGGELLDHWVDFDNDGDLDIAGYGSYIYVNNIGTNQTKPNTKPAPPSNLCVFFKDNKATFSWDPGSDLETPSAGLSYNLYVKQNGRFILSPLADLTNGFRKLGKRGNVDGNTSWTLTVPYGASLEWGVQAIDNSFQGSTFATNLVTTVLPFCGAVTTSRSASAPQGLYTPQNCSPNTTVVSNGATLTLTAGTNISLLPGFSVQPGSFLNAKLTNYAPTSSPCYHTASREGEITAVTETVKGEDEIFIYPNPNNGQFNIEANFPASESLSIEVVTISGLRIRNKQYEDVLFVNDVIDISDASQGLYIVRFVLKNGKVINKKVVKL